MTREDRITPVSRERYRNGDPIQPGRGCDHCAPVLINGPLTHETGCRSAWKDRAVRCRDCRTRFFPTFKGESICARCFLPPEARGDDDPDDPRLDELFGAYVQCALRTSTDAEGTPLDRTFGPMDIATETMEKMRGACGHFLHHQGDLVGDRASRAGRDFWLTRCRCGAGFRDGNWPEPDDYILAEGATCYGPVRLYVGDDGLIHA